MAQWTDVDLITASDDGVDVANQINNLRDAFTSGSSGATRPANAVAGMVYSKTIAGGFQRFMVTGAGTEVGMGTVTTATGAFTLPITSIEAALTSSGRGVPTGTIIMHGSITPPPGYLKLNGAAYSRTTYAELFAKIGTTYGSGDGSTTFNVDDWRGIFPRGWDDGRGVDSGRVFGSEQLDAVQDHTHASAAAASGTQLLAGGVNGAAVSGSTTGNMNTGRSATETRPRNIATLFCIKF